MAGIRSLLEKGGTYALGKVLNQAIPFLLLPILTRYLSPKDYGIVSNFEAMIAISTTLVGINLSGAIARNYFDYDKSELKVFIGSCLKLIAISFIITLSLFFFGQTVISSFSSIPLDWVLLVPLAALGLSLSMITLVLWQVRGRPVLYSAYLIFRTTLNVLLSLLLVIIYGMLWRGRVLAIFIVTCLAGLFGLYVIFKDGYIKFQSNDHHHMKSALIFGLPLVPHKLGGWGMSMVNRFFISRMVGVDEAGLYVVGYQIGGVLGLVQIALNLAWVPWFYAKLKTERAKDKLQVVKITYLYFIVSLLGAIFLTLIAPWVLSFFVGKGFQGADRYVFWISMGFAFNGMYLMVCNYLFYERKTYLLAIVTMSCAIVNIILNKTLIDLNGSVGAAQATCISFFLNFIGTWILSAKVHKMPWMLWHK